MNNIPNQKANIKNIRILARKNKNKTLFILVLFMFWVLYTCIQPKPEDLLIENKKLKETKETINKAIDSTNQKITILQNQEKNLKIDQQKKEYQLNQIKEKYEKANNYANSFTNDSIRWYFANL